MSDKNSKRDFLLKTGATPAEAEIFAIVTKVFKKKDAPVSNGDIAEIHGTHRTNIRNHLVNMIRKGIVIRHRHRYYLPAKVF